MMNKLFPWSMIFVFFNWSEKHVPWPAKEFAAKERSASCSALYVSVVPLPYYYLTIEPNLQFSKEMINLSQFVQVLSTANYPKANGLPEPQDRRTLKVLHFMGGITSFTKSLHLVTATVMNFFSAHYLDKRTAYIQSTHLNLLLLASDEFMSHQPYVTNVKQRHQKVNNYCFLNPVTQKATV